MPLTKKKLVTIIAPESIEDALVEALSKVTPGLSVVPIRGRGAHGQRPDSWHSGNLQIEMVVAPSHVERVLEVAERFEAQAPLVGWVADVEAWPARKFA